MMNYRQTVEYLFATTPSFQQVGADAYKPGLERISNFCQLIGNPQNSYLTIHVAGTNGKGSVSHLLASVLQCAGYRVGLFTSPHLRDFRERMRVDGEMISEQDVVDFVARHREDIQQAGLSFFEITTAMAFNFFAESDVEVAVIETGLGGRLDATNIITPILSVVTNIGLDHTDLLGTTLQAVAREKAGIIKQGVPVVLGEASEEYNSVFEQRAAALSSRVIYAEQEIELLEQCACSEGQMFRIERRRDNHRFTFILDLAGEYQNHNVLTVAAAADYLDQHTHITISRYAFLDGMATAAVSTQLAGRWQILGRKPLIVCDTGHNAHGVRYVAEQLRSLSSSYDNIYCVLGFARDKQIDDVLKLFPAQAHFVFTQASTPRALPAEELAAKGAEAGLKGEVIPSVREAYEWVRARARQDDVIFVGGSNYVVAEIM
jgi:dihydrofolate synthase/folylpolyglutamate synthase